MKKAYDLSLLLSNLKDHGLVVAEGAAEALGNGIFDWLEESAKISENKIDDMLAVGYPHARKLAMDQINKIDGQEG